MINVAHTYYIYVLEEEIKVLRSRIEPHDTGHLYTTINTLEHRVSDLRKSLDQTSITSKILSKILNNNIL